MGIIGVVAALTLPNLNSSTGDKEKVAKVKKVYSNLNDAMGRAIAVYGPYNEWTLKDSSTVAQYIRVGERLSEFMKVSKNCSTSSGCFKNDVKLNCGSTSSDLSSAAGEMRYKFILADGTAISLTPDKIYIDIDGQSKGANTVSKDIFGFGINSETGEITPMGSDLLAKGVNFLTCSCFNDGDAECTAWVIQNDNMDYLKCPSKLTDNNTSCK